MQFELKITVVPKDATLKLDGEIQQLTEGVFTTRVAQRIRKEVEVDHDRYQMQTHTIEMKEGGINETIELVSCQELKNCKPNWTAWGSWKECVPRCYNNYYTERSNSVKERTRFYLPDPNYLQDDWKGDEKEEKKCSSDEIPKCPYNGLERIEVKNSYTNTCKNTDDDFFVKICNPVKCCQVELNTNYNDFNCGNLDYFWDSHLNDYDGYHVRGNCLDFNITVVSQLSIMRRANGAGEDWVGAYMDLKSASITRRCSLSRSIPANQKWYIFYDCDKL